MPTVVEGCGESAQVVVAQPLQPSLAGRLLATDTIGSMMSIDSSQFGNSVPVVRAAGWPAGSSPEVPWLIHGFSSRVGGVTGAYRAGQATDLNLGFTASDETSAVATNRARFVSAVAQGNAILGLVTLRQVHSSVTLLVGAADVLSLDQPAVLEGDGLMTSEPGVLLGIQTADCIPVLVADRAHRAVAAFHAGWRGTVARIVESGVARMRAEWGSRPQDLIAFIGPGIGQCCYSVGGEVRERFASQFGYAGDLFQSGGPSGRPSDSLTHLDLPAANRRQLLEAGIDGANIFLTGLCTGCDTDRFFSHRVEHGFTGRMMSIVGIAPTAS